MTQVASVNQKYYITFQIDDLGGEFRVYRKRKLLWDKKEYDAHVYVYGYRVAKELALNYLKLKKEIYRYEQER